MVYGASGNWESVHSPPREVLLHFICSSCNGDGALGPCGSERDKHICVKGTVTAPEHIYICSAFNASGNYKRRAWLTMVLLLSWVSASWQAI